MLKERKRTGISIAKLAQRLENVQVKTIITTGPGVPKIAERKPNRGSRNNKKI